MKTSKKGSSVLTFVGILIVWLFIDYAEGGTFWSSISRWWNSFD